MYPSELLTIDHRSEDTSRPQPRLESTNVYNRQPGIYSHSTTEASRAPRSSEQAQVTTGFATYDEWCTRSR